MRSSILVVIWFMVIIVLPALFPLDTYSQTLSNIENPAGFQHPFPIVKDPHLKVEIVSDGLSVPTGILFLDKQNILVLQRYTSGFALGGLTTVNHIVNGSLRDEPILIVPSGLCDTKNTIPSCENFNERGLLGITGKKINVNNASLANNFEVFLYYTEITLNGEALGNRVYKYLWDGSKLINPRLILDLPALPTQSNVGGRLLIGPDGYLYAIIGDLTISNRTIPIHEDPVEFRKVFCCQAGHRGQLQNIINGPPPDNTSVILRINPENGLPPSDNPFNIMSMTNNSSNDEKKMNHVTNDTNTPNYNSSLTNRYYSYGIRNSFGLAFDPITGVLWDTENGEDHYDELNMVTPGINSGWSKIVGPIGRINATETDLRAYGFDTWKALNLKHSANVTEADLVNLPGSKYSDPEFSWRNAIGVTALEFLNSSKLGDNYKNNLFVGDYNNGNLYFFKLNKTRDGIEFYKNQTGLSDLVADDPRERSQIVFGTGFDIITDIKTGPDGYLYVVSYSEYSTERPDNISRIYRIVPSS
jgi:glucose/arabinose dehydrogenase